MINDPLQSKDDIEQWMVEKFGDNFQPDAPEDAWQKLEPFLPAKKKRRLLLFWWPMLLTAGLIVLFSTLFSINNASKPVTSDILPAIETNPELQNKYQADIPSTFQNAKPVVTQPMQLAPLSVIPKKQTKTLNTSTKSSEKQTGPFMLQGAFIPVPVIGDNTTGDNAFIETKNSLAPVFLDAVMIKKTVLATVPSTSPNLKQQEQVIRKTTARHKKKGIFLGIEATPFFYTKGKTASNPSMLAFSEVPSQSPKSWSAGLNLAVEPFPNWRFSIGIQPFRQVEEARHTATLRLIDGTCLNPNDPGLKEYQFSYRLISGSGNESDLSLRLQQQDSGSSMPPDEPFVLDMKTVRRSTAWRIPLLVERRFGTGKWHFLLSGGALLELPGKNQVEVIHFSEACQDLCFQSGRLPEVKAVGRTSTSLGWQAGIGMERKVLPKLSIRVQPVVAVQNRGIQGGLSAAFLFSN